jgi:hypothetical protein
MERRLWSKAAIERRALAGHEQTLGLSSQESALQPRHALSGVGKPRSDASLSVASTLFVLDVRAVMKRHDDLVYGSEVLTPDWMRPLAAVRIVLRPPGLQYARRENDDPNEQRTDSSN